MRNCVLLASLCLVLSSPAVFSFGLMGANYGKDQCELTIFAMMARRIESQGSHRDFSHNFYNQELERLRLELIQGNEAPDQAEGELALQRDQRGKTPELPMSVEGRLAWMRLQIPESSSDAKQFDGWIHGLKNNSKAFPKKLWQMISKMEPSETRPRENTRVSYVDPSTHRNSIGDMENTSIALYRAISPEWLTHMELMNGPRAYMESWIISRLDHQIFNHGLVAAYSEQALLGRSWTPLKLREFFEKLTPLSIDRLPNDVIEKAMREGTKSIVDEVAYYYPGRALSSYMLTQLNRAFLVWSLYALATHTYEQMSNIREAFFPTEEEIEEADKRLEEARRSAKEKLEDEALNEEAWQRHLEELTQLRGGKPIPEKELAILRRIFDAKGKTMLDAFENKAPSQNESAQGD